MAKIQYLTLILILLLSHTIRAQQEPAWKAEHLGLIEWMRVTELGYIVVSTRGSLKCLDPHTGEQLWETDALGTVREDMFSEISGTQYIQIGYGVNEESRADLPMIALVDVISGTLVFDSRKERV